jgi:hypothetical protein
LIDQERSQSLLQEPTRMRTSLYFECSFS